jgi:AcrR family transcriptional regulator
MATRVTRRVRARRGEGERLREEIVAATEGLLISTGSADAVSIRAVAEAVGVTPPSIYMHFAHKEDLILEVCEHIFRALDAVIVEATCGECDPLDEVKAIGRAYIRFGLEHPEQYRLLFMTRTPQLEPDGMRERIEGVSGFSRVVAAAQRCIDEGAFAPGDAFMVACGLWSGVHGLTSLFISKPTFPWPDRDDLIEHVLDGYVRGLIPEQAAR